MRNEKKQHANNEKSSEQDNQPKNHECGCTAGEGDCSAAGAQENKSDAELEAVKGQLEEKNRQCEEYLGMAQRIAAEFDNYKRRTAKEKEALYGEAVSDVAAAFLPVVDNMERALQAASAKGETGSLKEGVDMVFRQMQEVMKNLGIEEIKSVGQSFDPQYHNAVMHIEDEAYGENTIVEEFQKGYIIKDRVIRHSMVKVAN